MIEKQNVFELIDAMPSPWTPQSLVRLENESLNLIKGRGKTDWMVNEEGNQILFVFSGHMHFETIDGITALLAGQLIRIPKLTEYRLSSELNSYYLLISLTE